MSGVNQPARESSRDQSDSNGLSAGTPNRAKSRTFRVTTVRPFTFATAAIIASSYSVSDWRCISFAQQRKVAPSIGNTFKVALRSSSQASISPALSGSCSRVSSMPACISPSVTEARWRVWSSTDPIHRTTVAWGAVCAALKSHSYRAGTPQSVQCRDVATPYPAPIRHERFGACRLLQKQLFQRRTCSRLQPSPLVDRNQNGGLCAASGHHLRPLADAGVEQFTETGFGVLLWPD